MMIKLSILFAVLALAVGQRMRSSTDKCPVSLPAQYLSSINAITDSTLGTMGTALPIFRPLTTPLNYGLQVRLPMFQLTPPTVGQLNVTVTRYGGGMKLFANSLLSMLDKWHAEADIRRNHLPSTREIIRLNEITRTTLGDLGRKYPGLRPLTDPLPFALIFNPFTGRGGSVFNWYLDPATVEDNLLMLSGNLTQMAGRWTQTTDRFLQLEQQCRRN